MWSKLSRHARGYGTQWDRIRKQVLERDHYLCQMCLQAGFPRAGKIVDHRTPKAHGGTDDLENLWTLCPEHDREKQLTDEGKTVKVQVGLDGWPVCKST